MPDIYNYMISFMRFIQIRRLTLVRVVLLSPFDNMPTNFAQAYTDTIVTSLYTNTILT